jgi:hypothetical protein
MEIAEWIYFRLVEKRLEGRLKIDSMFPKLQNKKALNIGQ